MMTGERKVIGRSDKIDLPEFKIFNLDAKVDTGAAICAIHCHEIQLVRKNGLELLQFKLLDPSHPDYNEQTYHSHHFELARIKNSFGQTEERYVVTTPVIIFGKTIETRFSLTDRKDLKFPILLGRQFLRKRFIVDVAKKNVSFKKKK
jgi:hypothetical protein